jgi:predicted phage-related endonuclease
VRFVDCEQNSAKWIWARTGRITASRICDVMATLKRGGEAASRRDYRAELIAERLTGTTENRYVSKEMRYGSEQEPFARTAYEIRTGNIVDQVGFVFHPRLDFSGASPDGLICEDGGIEFKCPKTTTHLAYMAAGIVPKEYEYQMLWNIACAEREWWDFASFDARLPEKLRLFIVRMLRDDARIGEMEREVMTLNNEIDTLCEQLGVMANLDPIEAFAKSEPSKRELNLETLQAEEIFRPTELRELVSKDMYVEPRPI